MYVISIGPYACSTAFANYSYSCTFFEKLQNCSREFWKLQNYSLALATECAFGAIYALEIFLGIWRNTNTYCFKHDANALRAFFAYCFKHVKMRTCMQMRQNVPKCVTLHDRATKLQNCTHSQIWKTTKLQAQILQTTTTKLQAYGPNIFGNKCSPLHYEMNHPKLC